MTPLEMAKKAEQHLEMAEAWIGESTFGVNPAIANAHAQIAIGYATTLQALLTQGPWPGEGSQ
jgi:hypothetical protein